MKKIFLVLALAGFVGAGVASPTMACEGGKCKMERSGKDAKAKKGRKGEKAESCHMTAATVTADKSEAKSCCAKKEAPKAETAKETSTQR